MFLFLNNFSTFTSLLLLFLLWLLLFFGYAVVVVIEDEVLVVVVVVVVASRSNQQTFKINSSSDMTSCLLIKHAINEVILLHPSSVE